MFDKQNYSTNKGAGLLITKTLRDEFAMVALKGLLQFNDDYTNAAQLASDAYDLADEMMEARK